MKHCAEYEEWLNDFLDEEILPVERAAVERHLEGCAGCREFLEGLRSLRERTAALPLSLEPERNLWPGIRKALPIRRAWLPGSLTGFPAWLRGWGGLIPAAASIVIVLAIVVVVMIGLRQSAVPPGPGDGEAGAPAAGPTPIARGEAASPARTVPAALPPQGSLELLEAEYRAATEKLLAALQRERGGASPEAVKVIEENLRIVDRAIQEIHRAAVDHPGHRVDERVVISLYRTRFELLRQAVRLASREEEEKKS
jgi:anti-sigma factor RsiW